MPIPFAWTLGTMRELAPVMGPASVIRYARSLKRRTRKHHAPDETVTFRLRAPYSCDIHLRVADSDLDTFDEIFVIQVYRPVLAAVASCRTIVDLGSNIGLSGIYLASHFPDARVFCVEPGRRTHGVLDRNVAHLKSTGRLTSLLGAVWASAEELEPDPARPPQSNLLVTRAARIAGSERIRGYPIGELLELSGFERIDLLKVDIEGSERQLFSGDLSWLGRIGAMAVEFHRTSRADTRFDALMAEHGFRIAADDGHTVVAVRRPD